MYKSLEKQIKVMALLQQGKKTVEICKEVKVADSTIDYIRRYGPGNVNRLVNLLILAAENRLVNEDQASKLRVALENLKSS